MAALQRTTPTHMRRLLDHVARPVASWSRSSIPGRVSRLDASRPRASLGRLHPGCRPRSRRRPRSRHRRPARSRTRKKARRTARSRSRRVPRTKERPRGRASPQSPRTSHRRRRHLINLYLPSSSRSSPVRARRASTSGAAMAVTPRRRGRRPRNRRSSRRRRRRPSAWKSANRVIDATSSP